MSLDLAQTSSQPTIVDRQVPVNNYIYLGLCFILLQLAGLFILGSQPVSLLSLSIIDVGCLLLVMHYGLGNSNALIIVTALAFQITVAAVIKLLIGQPLEENLLVPDTTFAIELVYFLTLLVAFYFTKAIRIPNLFPNPIVDPDLLMKIAIGTSVVSMATTLLYIGQNAEIGQEYGEINSASSPLTVAVRGFGTLGLVCCTARAVLLSNRAKLFDPLSFIIFALSVAIGLSSNSREGVAAPIVAVLLTGVAFGYRLRIRTLIAGGIFAIVFVNYISPALLLTRGERDVLGPLERTVYASEVAVDLLLDTPKAQEYRGLMAFDENIRLGRYFGFYNTLADRVGIVQTVDLVASGIQASSNLAYDELPNAFSTLLPENVFALFGYQRPAAVPVGDLVAWTAGISPYGFVSFLAIPENAEGFAVGGLPAVAYRTFFAYALCFAVLYLFGGGDLRSNILAITLFLLFFHPAAEASSISLYYFALRIAPQFVISYFLIVKFAGILAGSRAMKSA